MEDLPDHSNEEAEDTEGTLRMREADARLSIIEDHVAERHGGENSKDIDHAVDLSLKDLVNQTRSAWERGELSVEKAQDMILIALEKIDEYKNDDDPSTNGEIIATALSQLPNELLGGALEEFLLAEGSVETKAILSEIARNNPNTTVV